MCAQSRKPSAKDTHSHTLSPTSLGPLSSLTLSHICHAEPSCPRQIERTRCPQVFVAVIPGARVGVTYTGILIQGAEWVSIAKAPNTHMLTHSSFTTHTPKAKASVFKSFLDGKLNCFVLKVHAHCQSVRTALHTLHPTSGFAQRNSC